MEFERIINPVTLNYLKTFPCVAVLGPRQVGKTYTAKKICDLIDYDTIYLDLESDEDIQKLKNAEQYFKDREDKLIIIDEIQRNPELFTLLRAVIDKKRKNGRFLILGSASPELLAKSSETLAGRIAYLEMHPLVYAETKSFFSYDSLWLKGGFPESVLQSDDKMSLEIRIQFIQTYIERELPILGLSANPIQLKNLLRMIAHAQGQVIKYSELSNSLGIDLKTVKRYIDYFENAFLIRRLEPYFTNSKKRLVKSPKIFIRDTGIYHALFNLETKEDLDGFIGKGNSWESFVIQQIISQLKPNVSPYFYRTQDGSEVDLVLVKGMSPVIGLEIKYSNSPKVTKGTTISAKDLGEIPIFVVTHSTNEDYKHNELVTITSFEGVFSHLNTLKLIR